MSILGSLLNFLLVICSIFMICLVLIQRGRGGGLAGAFGAAGGSSAFGTKAGDVFTRITIITAGVWFLLAMLLVFLNNQGTTSAFDVDGGSSRTVPITDAAGKKGTAPTGTAKAGSPVGPRIPGAPATGSGPVAPAPDIPPPAGTGKPAAPATRPATNPDLPAVFDDAKPAPTDNTGPAEPAKKPE